MGKIIGVLSLKGGVGKTSSVVSLGASLANLGKKVLLVDANFSLPNLGVHLKILEPKKTIHDVLSRETHISDAVHDLEWGGVIPGSLFPNKKINPLKLGDHLRSLKHKYDVILIDSSPALNEETLATMLASDELLVVTTPDCSTLYNTIKAIKIAKKRGTRITGLILNKVYDKKFELDIKEIELATNVPVMAVIPHDVRVSRAQSYFVPFVFHKPFSKGSTEYHKLAGLLVGERYSPRRGFFTRSFYPGKQEINRDIFYESVFGS
jgi:MinD-like ATPase involved in chromosome partitioning or flagellar assembly